ncbi:MAG: nucleotidyltransferase family protein [Candidatus Auribacterota bacterium]|nr:nucleotidyltransferase family protein [Candidatus Auribacterota bacterium]
MNEIKTIIRRQSANLKKNYGLRVVGIFGSYARGEQQSESDIDLLVEILKPISILELVGAEIYLSEILGVKVELVPRRSVREEARETISREAVAI